MKDIRVERPCGNCCKSDVCKYMSMRNELYGIALQIEEDESNPLEFSFHSNCKVWAPKIPTVSSGISIS